MIAPNGTLVMYSAALSSVISDNGGDHSLFVQELLKEIRVPDLMAEETLNRTRVGVTRASRSEQVPWISSSLAEDFSFIPGAAGPRPSSPPPAGAILRRRRRPPRTGAPTSAVRRAMTRRRKSRSKLRPPPDKPADNKPARQDRPALADDPTIKSLTAKLADNPDDGGALYRRGQVYASKGAYELAIGDFDDRCGSTPRMSKPLTIDAGRAP